MRRIGVLTTGRQDWGILRSTARALHAADDFALALFAGGMACSPTHGRVVDAIRAEGLPIAEELPWLEAGLPIGDESGRAVAAIANALQSQHQQSAIDGLVLVGDRYETFAAAFAATLARIPIVHLHGGEETEGAIDNSLRHALTKLAHLHLVSHKAYARRVVAMGEDPALVHVVGAPGLDNLRRDDLATRAEIEAHLGLELEAPVIVVTLHPATLGDDVRTELDAVVGAMDATPATYVIALPNTDPGHEIIRAGLEEAGKKPNRRVVPALGERRYLGLLRLADAVLGNSSSALLEAPALALPAVNVGDRQKGRLRAANVIDAPATKAGVLSALQKALDPAFRQTLRADEAPFGDGHAAERILAILRNTNLPHPPVKRGVVVP